MKRADLSKFILERLSAAANRDDLIRDVCFREGIPWPEAEAMVDEVAAENEKTILRRQSPIALTTSAMFSLAGALLTGVAVVALFGPALAAGNFTLMDVYFIIMNGHGMALMLVAGLALSIGGMISFFDTIFQLNGK
jgi:hypothetical protein